MAKYAFNHDAEKLSDVIGITGERCSELTAACMATVTAAFFTDKDITKDSDALEMLINEGQPVGVVEALLLGFLYGQTSEKTKVVVKKMSHYINDL